MIIRLCDVSKECAVEVDSIRTVAIADVETSLTSGVETLTDATCVPAMLDTLAKELMSDDGKVECTRDEKAAAVNEATVISCDETDTAVNGVVMALVLLFSDGSTDGRLDISVVDLGVLSASSVETVKGALRALIVLPRLMSTLLCDEGEWADTDVFDTADVVGTVVTFVIGPGELRM